MTAGDRGRPGEEIASSVLHGFGAVLALAGLAALVTLAAIHGDARHVVGSAVFGVTLVAMFAASAIYHGVTHGAAKNLLRVLDHAAIYLVIAGTYTPFMLVSLRGAWGWSLLAVVWTAAVAGCVLAASLGRRHGGLRVAIYIAMGWIGVVALRPLLAGLGPGGLSLVVGGGVVYTLGVVFYTWHRLRFNHAVWHAFVLGGSVLHFLAVLWYVIPRASG
ncbi:MAG TPA: hemolysin III family protein [Vicinamibacterales bacterium]|nr:hemolysin III family protein [Vicinamibacterales bacterium]